MFKGMLGSPRLANAGAADPLEEEESILSPRHFLKIISSGIDGIRKNRFNAPNQNNYAQFVATFEPYLQSFSAQYKQYEDSTTLRKNINGKNEEMQLEVKVSRIPQIYFTCCQQFVLELYPRAEAQKKQQHLSEYLDEIQLILFSKSGKYPEKSHIILENMGSLGSDVDSLLMKMSVNRQHCKVRLMVLSQRQLRVRRIQQKMRRIKEVVGYMQLMRKMKGLKALSGDQKAHQNEQVLLKIKKNELSCCHKLASLSSIVSNIQSYRNIVKQKLEKQFVLQIQHIVNSLLQYDKEEWKNINVPQGLFNDQAPQNITANNITILDQSYFAFETGIVSIGTQGRGQAIAEVNEEEVLSMSLLQKLWQLIRQFDLYDQQQISEHFTKLLVRHNIQFNHDMQQYLSYLYQNSMKDVAKQSVLKGGQSYAEMKGRKAREEQRQKDIHSQGEIELSQQKISAIDMKLFLKVVRYQFGLLKKVLTFLTQYQDLQFLGHFKHKFTQFLQSNITYFAGVKKISHEWSVQDFMTYLQIILYWQHEEYYQVLTFCQKLKNSKIEQYLTAFQKNLLVRDLKHQIQQSSYLPANIPYDSYLTLHSVLLGDPHPEIDADMSITLQGSSNTPAESYNQQAITLKLIHKNILFRNKLFRVCDSFLELARNIEVFAKLRASLSNYQGEIEEKMCELIGFYAWYNQKVLTSPKNGVKTLKNYCTFFSTLLLLKEVLANLSITNKKLDKTQAQLKDCQSQIRRSITMTPFLTIQKYISQLYDAKVTSKTLVPTVQTQRIVEVVGKTCDCLKEYFPLQYQPTITQSLVFTFMQTTLKLIHKNYCGYLVNMEKRGLAEVKWFLPKLRAALEATVVGSKDNLIDRKGQVVGKAGSTFCVFEDELEAMERLAREKGK